MTRGYSALIKCLSPIQVCKFVANCLFKQFNCFSILDISCFPTPSATFETNPKFLFISEPIPKAVNCNQWRVMGERRGSPCHLLSPRPFISAFVQAEITYINQERECVCSLWIWCCGIKFHQRQQRTGASISVTHGLIEPLPEEIGCENSPK